MALDAAVFLVTREIALRSGLLESRYRIADGRFVLDTKDLSRVRFSSNEYINGLSGVERVSEAEAQALISQNGYVMGDKGLEPDTQTTTVENQNEQPQVEEETHEETEPESESVEEEQVPEESESENEEENNETTTEEE